MQKKIRMTLVAAVMTICLLLHGTNSYAACAHNYTLYSRTVTNVYTVPCVTPGCTVTVYCYHDVYRCTHCGDIFFQDIEDSNHHSMHHNY